MFNRRKFKVELLYEKVEGKIVEVCTPDKLPLYGLYIKAKKSQTILINIHGTASNFYENYFIFPLGVSLKKEGISLLSTNNRGASVMQVYPHMGAAIERFEDCILDIDAWIKYALSLGYKEIILQGHSLGAEKVIYYLNKGKYVKKIKGVILLAPADSYGYTTKVCLSKKELHLLLEEAKNSVKVGDAELFLKKKWLCHGNTLPKGAKSFINFFKGGSELSKALPLRNGGGLEMYKKIKVPILTIIGNQEEYTVIPIKEALIILKKENSLSKVVQIKDCNHDFEGKEKEVSREIINFLKER